MTSDSLLLNFKLNQCVEWTSTPHQMHMEGK